VFIGCKAAPPPKKEAIGPPKPTRAPLEREIKREAKIAFNEAIKEIEHLSSWKKQDCLRIAKLFDKAIEKEPSLAEAYFNKGVAYQKCGMHREAKQAFKDALEVDPNLAEARVNLAWYEAKRTTNRYELQKYFRDALRGDPQSVEAYVNLAILLRQEGTPQAIGMAVKNIRRALAVDAEYMPAFTTLALLLLDASKDNPRRLHLASLVCRQAVKLNDSYAPIYNVWGLINLKQNKLTMALAKFMKATELDENFVDAYMNVGAIVLGFRGYEDAETAYRKVTQIQPKNVDAWIGLGVALRGLGRFKEAEEAYQQALKLDSARSDVYFNLGVLYQDYIASSKGSIKAQIDMLRKGIDYFQRFIGRGGAKYPEKVQEARKRIENTRIQIQALREVQAMQKKAERPKLKRKPTKKKK
jgi:tetratricopeptide (TPR) repeat protein